MATLVSVFKNTESKDETNYGNFHANSKAENVFKSIYTTII